MRLFEQFKKTDTTLDKFLKYRVLSQSIIDADRQLGIREGRMIHIPIWFVFKDGTRIDFNAQI